MDTKETEQFLSQQKKAEESVLNAKKIHIHVKQRKRKKFVTTASGLNQELNFERVTRYLQQKLGCNGSVCVDPDIKEKYILLQGNWAAELAEFLLQEHMARKELLEIHST
ncbi:translation initiation factor 1 [Angomonas deanei]|uniref:Translation initiation factor SUI1, putative n=1 Tax=Angomonas deanei TaxID=59799 RepID=A0A7G2CMT7_9TRYP|nr:translation initiation factor 1 [Angomonas deanei]CAD2219873.1 Translation initiation factor SUI1, putative [Angomonas deanei]|eukprot:EPY27606.1 translation initiation factor 1 [Angomonas deanei]